MSGVIDFHCHAYPHYVSADTAGFAEQRGEPKWASMVGPKSIQGWATPRQMLKEMDRAGVEASVLLGWYWEQHATCIENNEWLREFAAADPARLLPFCTFNTKAGADAVREVEQALDGGARGIGELFPKAQEYAFDDPVLLEICRLAGEARVPVLLHVTEAAGHDYAGRLEAPLMDYVRLAQACPATTFVFAHWGGGLPFYTLNRTVKKALENVYFDSAASPLLYAPEVWRQCCELVGPERLLFGSDYPLRIYPRSEKQPEMTRLLAEARKHLPDGAYDAVLHQNARRLLNLST